MGLGCVISFGVIAQSTTPSPPPLYTSPSSSLTGSNGDAGDPNNATVQNAVTNNSQGRWKPVSQDPVQLQTQTEVQAPPQPPSQIQAQDTSQTLPQNVAQSPDSTQDPASTTPQNSVAQSSQSPQMNNNSADALGATSVGRAAFVSVVHNLMPLNPQQIITLRNMFDQSQQAVAKYPGVPPKPTSSSILVNMSPGSTPPVIRLRAGYVTSLVFLDSTGQPWPVVGYDLGNPKAFNIQPTAPDGKSATLIVQALVRYEQGNLAVMLKGESTPVMLTLMPGQHAVDYRVDLRVPGLGPNATVSMIGIPAAASPVLLAFLDGVPPAGAKLLDVEGPPAQAWLFGGRIYLRTRLSILSPGWLATMSSPDGTHVYKLMKTPIVLVSQRGALAQLSIKGW